MDDEENGILNIELSDEEVDVVKKKADRTGQSEDEFQAVKRDYRAKIENGEIYKSVKVPLEPGANKMRTQELIHAVEELYFLRRFKEGADLVQKAFADGGAGTLDNDSRQLLETYKTKCQQKLSTSGRS